MERSRLRPEQYERQLFLRDAPAALGTIHNKELGRTRHIDTGMLRIQQTATEKQLEYNKVLGGENPADLLTKYLAQEIALKHCRRIGLTFDRLRANEAPQFNAATNIAICEVEENRGHQSKEEEEWWQEIQGVLHQPWRRK